MPDVDVLVYGHREALHQHAAAAVWLTDLATSPSAFAMSELVESIPSIHGAIFALIEPKGTVGGHRDPVAGSVRFNRGLMTPNDDDCCIWIDGEDLLYDETYLRRFQNMTHQPRIILSFAHVERPIDVPVVRRLNRWMIRRLVCVTATKNREGEKIGFVNKVFGFVPTRPSSPPGVRWGATIPAPSTLRADRPPHLRPTIGDRKGPEYAGALGSW